MSVIKLGLDYSSDSQIDSIRSYINNGKYTTEQENRITKLLLMRMNNKVNNLLPEGWRWNVETSELVSTVGDTPLEEEDIEEIFDYAWERVKEDLEQIEDEIL